MIILGIDPGYAIVGWGVLEYSGNSFKTLGYGSIQTPAHTDADSRLLEIYRGMKAVIEKYKPAQMAVEELFFNTNSKTAIMVAQARGVILLSARLMGVEVFEYTPLQVKQAVVGYGRAEKRQVMLMTQTILGLSKLPRPDDAADALALAVCHAHSAKSKLLGLM